MGVGGAIGCAVGSVPGACRSLSANGVVGRSYIAQVLISLMVDSIRSLISDKSLTLSSSAALYRGSDESSPNATGSSGGLRSTIGVISIAMEPSGSRIRNSRH